LAGAGVEAAAANRLEHSIGLAGEAYQSPPARRLLRAGRLLTGAGLAGGLTATGLTRISTGRRRPPHPVTRLIAATSGMALMAASACTRFGIFRAGVISAREPRYTVVPQRERAGGSSVGGGQAGPGHP
jgi:hypothetical protein